MNDVNGTLQYKGREYKIVFNLNVLQLMQEKYGSYDAWMEKITSDEADVSAIIYGFKEMLNEGIEIDNENNGTDYAPLTDKQVGRLLTEYGFEKAMKKLSDTVSQSTESAEKNA